MRKNSNLLVNFSHNYTKYHQVLVIKPRDNQLNSLKLILVLPKNYLNQTPKNVINCHKLLVVFVLEFYHRLMIMNAMVHNSNISITNHGIPFDVFHRDLDLWSWKSTRFLIFIKIKLVPSFVKFCGICWFFSVHTGNIDLLRDGLMDGEVVEQEEVYVCYLYLSWTGNNNLNFIYKTQTITKCTLLDIVMTLNKIS